MPPTDPASINVDCWLLIMGQLYGDFRTLSRLMQVSRQFLALAAPCLYGQLDDKATLCQIKYWSESKRNRLTALLLVSFGYDFTDWQNRHEERYGTQDSQEQEVWVPWTQDRTSEECVRFKFPLFINYFSLLKKVPSEVLGEKIWSWFNWPIGSSMDRNGIIRKPWQSQLFYSQVAKIIHEIRITSVQDCQHWMAMADHLAQLSVLDISIQSKKGEPISKVFKFALIMFVKILGARFPNTRLTIQEPETVVPQDRAFFVELNEILGSETMKVQGLENIESIMMAKKEWWTVARNLKCFEVSYKSMRPWGCSEDDLTEEDLKMMDCTARFLGKCPKLKAFHIYEVRESTRKWTDLFTWVRNERALLDGVQRIDLNFENEPYQQQRRQQQQQQHQQSFMQLEEFTCHHVPSTVVTDVMDMFRNSLERIEFCNGLNFTSAFGKDWSWPLTRLTTLLLESCQVQFEKLKYCVVLQELYLRYVYHDTPMKSDYEQSEITRWEIFPTMKQSLRLLHIIECDAAHYLDLDSLGGAQQLEELILDYDESWPIEPIDPNPAWAHWTLPRLKKLTLFSEYNVNYWQETLLKAARNLEMYSTPMSWLDLKTGLASSKLQGHREDKVEVINIFTTKIRYLEFGGVHTLNRVKHVQDCLQSLSLDHSSAGILMTCVNKELSWMFGFPFLTHINFYSSADFRNVERVTGWIESFEELILELLERPRMEWIITRIWTPSETFVTNVLTRVNWQDVPGAQSADKYDDSKSGEGYMRGQCFLETQGDRITEYFQLKK